MTTVIINLTNVFNVPIIGHMRFTPRGSTFGPGNVLIPATPAFTSTNSSGTVSITVEPGEYTAVLQAPDVGSYDVLIPTTDNGTVYFTDCIVAGVNPTIQYSLPADGSLYIRENGMWMIVTDLKTVARQVEFINSTQFYKGEAQAGTLTSTPNWRISLSTWTGSSLSVTWASGNANFDKIWNNRASLTYS